MCEQAGTGLWMIREEWRKLGYPPPRSKNDRSRKALDFFLPGDIGALEASSSNANPE
jgi:predicted HTH transcriptional regulator